MIVMVMTMLVKMIMTDEDFHDDNGDDDVGENDDDYVISEHQIMTSYEYDGCSTMERWP